MSAICLVFHVHQPFRLKPYSFDQIGHDHAWENIAQNTAILNQASDSCYLPANDALLRAIQNSDGQFRFAFSISGTCLEQLFHYRPDVIESFRRLAETGCVEFLAQPYYHSLAGIYAQSEFRRQVVKHEKAIQQLLEQRPTVFCNTGLLHADELLPAIEELGYKTILAEGTPDCLGSLHPDQVFSSGRKGTRVLARNAALSEELAGTMMLPQREKPPGKAFGRKIAALAESAECINIFLDYEFFGRYAPVHGTDFSILEAFPSEMRSKQNLHFSLPSDASDTRSTEPPNYHSLNWVSGVGETKDDGHWRHNHMQKDALKELYSCEFPVLKSGKPELMDQWGRLQTSDHFSYMSSHFRHNSSLQAFNPYPSPYDAYLNYMNVLSDFCRVLEKG